MIVGLDFDGTLKRSSGHDRTEREMWSTIIGAFQAAGHTVYVVTLRNNKMDPDEITRYLDDLRLADPVEVILCDFKAKREVCHARGLRVDIWIDDMPEFVSADF